MYSKNKHIAIIAVIAIISTLLSSCLSLPSFSRRNQSLNNEISINTVTSQIEALRREDYNTLRTTTGSSSTTRFSILFFPIGKYKTNSELYENAYYDAVDNLPNADALILPRQQITKVTIPLILVNYSKRKITVTGVGISVKGKVLENNETDVPFTIAEHYEVKKDVNIKQLSKSKITNQLEFESMFEKIPANNNEANTPTAIDFSKQYVIAVIRKPTRRNTLIKARSLKIDRDQITLAYKTEEGEKMDKKAHPLLLLLIDKKFQGDITLKNRD